MRKLGFILVPLLAIAAIGGAYFRRVLPARSLSSSEANWAATFAREKYKDVPIEFKDHGQLVARFTKTELLQKFPPEERRLYELLEDGESTEGFTPELARGWVTYGTVAANRILDSVYGNRWRASAKIRFTCLDNYKPVVGVRALLEHTGRFAFYRRDGRPDDPLFLIRNRIDGNKTVPAGPVYLTWEKMEDPQVRGDTRVGAPYQVIGMNLLDENEEKITVSSDASASVKRGADLYERICSRCHTINGDNGGKRGDDLTFVANRFQGTEGVLAQILDDPKSRNPNSTMTPMTVRVPDPQQREIAIDDLIAFLKQTAKDASSKDGDR